MQALYNIKEQFTTRLDAITYYRSIYLFVIRFRVIKLDIYIKEEDGIFTVSGTVSIVGENPGVTELEIINHIKKNS